ncbi:MAG TPA: polyribonucleotide nucleotidyltransferase [Tissierellaceae bacterium]|nr:polyribonucleotide nucleotidyltransferase [Tissierellaceae bacterium]
MEKKFIYKLADEDLIVTTGKVAEQAGGSCLVQYRDTVILATATASKEPREGIDFFPLSVDYEEKMYSVGKIPGGFIKREGRPSEKAVLACRLIDRPIRPLFPEGFRNAVQVIITVLSVDQDSAPEIVAMIGSSIALSISNIPFDGPTASVAVGRIGSEFVINPNSKQREESDIDLVVSGTEEAIMMVEAGADIVKEDVMLKAILKAHEEIKGLCKFIKDITDEIGKEKMEFEVFTTNKDIEKEIIEFGRDKLNVAIRTVEKQERMENIEAVNMEIREIFLEQYPEFEKDIDATLENMFKKEFRRLIIEENIRPDNRKADEIRTITSEVGLLPRTHGSGLFTRGQTQTLTVATLGVMRDAQMIDGIGEEDSKRYMHHYNFPPYSVGETGFMRGPGRREIGHGALAEKALLPVLPSEEDFPYSIRLVSEVLSSNGSSSQASVCGSTLSLLDAGVPIKAPVAGIAMGLIKEGDKIEVLADIQGLEDHLGDMDFKISGTEEGITAIQMDIKILGIDETILKEALEKAKIGRLHILSKMNETISTPRENVSTHAPKIYTMEVDPDKIRDIIGPGGKVINKIIDETGVKIDIEDDGKVFIAAVNFEDGEKAIDMIEKIVKEIEVGEIYSGKVTRIMNFGAFVDVLNGKEGLVHISNIAHERTNKVEDVLSVGDEVLVKVMEIDNQGRVNLSRKAVLPKEDKTKKKKS